MIEGAVICAAAMKISGDSTFRVSGVISVVIQDSVTTPGLAGVLDVAARIRPDRRQRDKRST
jgi:hypothetical protein